MNDRHVASLAPQKLDCAVRDNLVHVHVRRGAATRLKDINNKLVVKSSLHNPLGRGDNGLALLRVQQSQLHVSSRSRKFDQSHSPDEFLRKTQTRYGEVLNGPLGLSPIIRRTWNFDLAHRVLIQSIFFNCDHYLDAEESRRIGTKKHSLSTLKIVQFTETS